MSTYNTATDRDAHGRLDRAYRPPKFTQSTPGWWVRQFMNRPRRHLNHDLCRKVLRGDDPEGLVWPPGNRKPHRYFW